DDIRLQGKLMQDRLAEGMDGLDFQAAGCFKRAGKELTGPSQLSAIREFSLQLGDLLRQFGIAQPAPFGKISEYAVRHVGRCRPRIGQAKYLGRVRALEKQPYDPLRQDMRLARAGIGRHPGGVPRIGSDPLAFTRFDRYIGTLAHGASPPPSSSPPADHTRTRAR